MGRFPRYLIVAAASALAACTTLPPAEWTAPSVPSLPRQAERRDAPFHPQEEYQCGPAALATTLGAAGIRRTPEALKDEVYVPARKGSLQPEMLAAARRSGTVAYVIRPEAQALLTEVAAGNPVLVLQNLRFDWFPQWHYAVVVGYDLDAGTVALRSGREERLLMDLAAFDRTWARSGRWAFVAVPPDRLPATAVEQNYVMAAVALERVSPEGAEKAYHSALDAWPGNLIARIGLGNAAYRRGDLPGAEAALRRATADHPQSADAWNNLAQVLHEQGKSLEARRAAERALEIGGPRAPEYRQTLDAIAGS